MAQTPSLPGWMYSYSDVLYTVFRAILGLLLFIKGVYFAFNTQHLGELIEESRFNFNNDFLVYFISISHLLGGAFISLGLLTRLAIVLQLPVLLAAVIFNIQSQAFGNVLELFLAVFILVLLVYYLVKGPGKVSMDTYRKSHLL
jgi:putative oxidoreductase